MGNRIEGNLYVAGTLSAETMIVADNSVDDDSVEADAAIASTKLQHRHHAVFTQPLSAAADETRVIYVAQAAGTLESFGAGSITLNISGSTVTVDLKKNGTTVLTGVVSLSDSGNTAYVLESGTIASAAYVAGDCFTIVVDATVGGGTLATGLFASAVFDEAAT